MNGIARRALMAFMMPMLIASGCRNVRDTLYAAYADIPSSGWNPAEPVIFQPFPADTSLVGEKMTLILCARYRTSKPLPPLPLLVSIEDEKEVMRNDTLFLRTFNSDGNPIAKGVLGIAEVTDTLLHDFTLEKGLSVSISPLLPPIDSAGLLNIGIKLSNYESVSATP